MGKADEGKAKGVLDALSEHMFVGVDWARPGSDISVAVAMQVSADGSIRLMGYREFYSDPDVIDAQHDSHANVWRVR